jgi:NADH-quinone oxidoreductase subunit L
LDGERGWVRYFALIAAFTGSMNLLVIAGSFTTLFIGWELVGACSFLLIGFWYERPTASRAAIKAFLTTRIGDVGLLLGIAVLWVATGTDTYEGVMIALPSLDPTVVNAAVICLAIGAMGKSAQFPLHGWLPDAMEGPTPVSALIHAATMVAAGVYLVVRIAPLFERADAARTLLLVAGTISALGAALIATSQRDIKKVLAYSTISQLGFMFAALGVGAWAAAFFHLVTHAAFKALLFLSSGSVIHGSGTQDLHEMGGLRKAMPVTFAMWLVGVLALAGVAPLAGFFSKDAVLEAVWHYAPAAAVALFVTTLLTAYYCARTTRLAFFGERPTTTHAHESPVWMLLPLGVLAVPAIVVGFAHNGLFDLIGAHAEPLSVPISLTATVLALVGAVVGWRASAGPAGDAVTRERFAPVSGWFERAFGWDALVDRLVVRPVVTASRLLWAWGDRFAADGLVEGAAVLARSASARVSRLQSGDAQAYATGMAAAVALMLAASIWAGR